MTCFHSLHKAKSDDGQTVFNLNAEAPNEIRRMERIKVCDKIETLVEFLDHIRFV